VTTGAEGLREHRKIGGLSITQPPRRSSRELSAYAKAQGFGLRCPVSGGQAGAKPAPSASCAAADNVTRGRRVISAYATGPLGPSGLGQLTRCGRSGLSLGAVQALAGPPFRQTRGARSGAAVEIIGKGAAQSGHGHPPQNHEVGKFDLASR
jgi:3-hydroxyisobutyrate dehydrogenase-like beta-hydroxyacid dehydrogenase